MKPRCHICDNESEFLLTKDGYPLFKCPNCNLVFVFPMVEDTYLKEEVYSAKSGYQGHRAKEDLKSLPPTKRFDSVFGYLGNVEGKKILDVGASNGEFLYLLKKKGADTYGVEINTKTANTARKLGLNIFVGFLVDAKFPDNFFDYVHLGDILEHVTDPRKLLIECGRILKPGGAVIIRTLNMDCFWARVTLRMYYLFGIPWSAVTPPHHLHFFSWNNMNRLLGQCGFQPDYHQFELPPTLKYELGSLHLVKRYKNSRKLGDLFFALFAFALYIVLWSLDRLMTPLKKKDNEVLAMYKKV
jgi:SAM-dependent methyltransferase